MRVSTKGDYGIRALIELAHHFGKTKPTQSSEIAARQNIPESYLEQLLTTLRRAGFIRSVRGPQGGHALIRDPQELRVEGAGPLRRGGQGGPDHHVPHALQGLKFLLGLAEQALLLLCVPHGEYGEGLQLAPAFDGLPHGPLPDRPVTLKRRVDPLAPLRIEVEVFQLCKAGDPEQGVSGLERVIHEREGQVLGQRDESQ